MRNFIGKLFAKSPFGPLQQHFAKTAQCVSLLRPMFMALAEEDYEKVEQIAEQVQLLEHEADQIKQSIRMTMPRNVLMPVNRTDFLMLLREQDNIADLAEDVSILLTIRKNPIPGEIKEQLFELIDQIVSTFEHAHEVINEINSILESSFGGPETDKVAKMAKEVSTLEWKADQVQFDLAKQLFELEDIVSPVSIIQWNKIIETIGKIANHAENVADRILAMLIK